ncbi:hypothetical protein SARC_02887 [Sphaeroforma arctica JP610]|uniref:Uncharacterized protein n=1 Tax=Sphaeroforma arctica JP610 TaxID=667725 RepID=A0A0L0G7C2_9EUKA|nr:hypothetical protein SARC_02887 [Sphaeroforma arctica JP610]KNC84905.1 hypothetical protein SARC_02887 [Sphaeroforma arctica JP610]|eukprot:XP_014158807.1 hypothetical protein SARC_02887 [Sphaeroforma arctica JP610]
MSDSISGESRKIRWSKLLYVGSNYDKWWAHLIAAANTEYKDDIEGVLRYKHIKLEILAKQLSTPIHQRTPAADTAKIEGIIRFRRETKTKGTYLLAKLSEDPWALLIYLRRAFEHNSITINNSISFDFLKSFSRTDDDTLRTWCKSVTSIATMASKQNTIFLAVFVQNMRISGLSAADKDAVRQYFHDVPNRDDISPLLLCERLERWNKVAPGVHDAPFPMVAAASTTSAMKSPQSVESIIQGLTKRLDAMGASRNSPRPPTPCFVCFQSGHRSSACTKTCSKTHTGIDGKIA